MLKQLVRQAMKIIDADLEERMVDRFHYRKRTRASSDLQWKVGRPCPAVRFDAGGLQLRQEIFVFCGYTTGGGVLSHVDVYDIQKGRWVRRFPVPERMAQSHLGMVCDGERFMYAVSGQLGNECHPAIKDCFSLDTTTNRWENLPPLPNSRYAPTVAYWNGRLHVLGGSKEDRNEPSTEHYSLGVKDGRATENIWRPEAPIPRGGPHRACRVIQNQLYVFGGQEGDFVPVPGDPKFTCTGKLTIEHVYPDTYRLKANSSQWEKMADMPVKVSHIEFSTVVQGRFVITLGGQNNKDPKTSQITLTDAVQLYDTEKNSWKILGHLPYCSKSCIAGYHDGFLYMTTGQRERGFDEGTVDPSPLAYDRSLWKARLEIN